MQQIFFKEQFPKKCRPEISDLEIFLDDEIYILFRNFAEYILQKYDLRFGIPLWTEEYGWTYRIGKSGVYLITGIQIEKNKFVVDEIEIANKEQYRLLTEHIDEAYRQNRDDYLEKIAEKNKQQVERTKLRIAREKEEFALIQSKIIPGKYNVFRWPKKLDIHKLNRLYMLDAKGIQDEVLADEIGLTLYLRCKYGKEDMERMERKVIRCHGCGNEIGGKTDFRQCSCGLQYSYREYRRSYRRDNMPTGSAEKIFELFMQNWSTAKNYNEKIVLIDTLLHEFHLSLISGTTHRPVAMNFIDGTRDRVENIINNLARNI